MPGEREKKKVFPILVISETKMQHGYRRHLVLIKLIE